MSYFPGNRACGMCSNSESQKMAVKTDHVEQYATKCQSSNQLIIMSVDT